MEYNIRAAFVKLDKLNYILCCITSQLVRERSNNSDINKKILFIKMESFCGIKLFLFILINFNLEVVV